MTPTDELMSPASGVLVSSALADLRRVPLGETRPADRAALNATLDRVLPAPEVQQVPVAAFNSSI
jgi:FXSXX-COOH protein